MTDGKRNVFPSTNIWKCRYLYLCETAGLLPGSEVWLVSMRQRLGTGRPVSGHSDQADTALQLAATTVSIARIISKMSVRSNGTADFRRGISVDHSNLLRGSRSDPSHHGGYRGIFKTAKLPAVDYRFVSLTLRLP